MPDSGFTRMTGIFNYSAGRGPSRTCGAPGLARSFMCRRTGGRQDAVTCVRPSRQALSLCVTFQYVQAGMRVVHQHAATFQLPRSIGYPCRCMHKSPDLNSNVTRSCVRDVVVVAHASALGISAHR
jgi:hypothetical protein